MQILKIYRKCILFRDLENVFTNKVLDLIVLFEIYKCKWPKTAPSLKCFIRILKDRYTVERCLSVTKDKLRDFDLVWLPYKGLHRNCVGWHAVNNEDMSRISFCSALVVR